MQTVPAPNSSLLPRSGKSVLQQSESSAPLHRCKRQKLQAQSQHRRDTATAGSKRALVQELNEHLTATAAGIPALQGISAVKKQADSLQMHRIKHAVSRCMHHLNCMPPAAHSHL